MSDVIIRKEGRIGRITLDRPKALNALSYDMVREIERALDLWKNDASLSMLVIDARGERAFCAGGDIQEMYDTARAGDFEYGRRFWRDEYRMNAKLFEFPKPVASFLQGFTMGGGVGVGCHGSHRVVCESSQIAMPECGIGLIPDVGGSLLLARAPGRLGEYLGVTASRMGPADAIYAGFADYYVPEANWPALIAALAETGDWERIDAATEAPAAGQLEDMQAEVDRHFGGERLGDILRSLAADETDFTAATLKVMRRNSPLSMAATVEIIHRVRGTNTIRAALSQEYRFTHRSAEMGDFIEGIRAAIIDKDRTPRWKHKSAEAVNPLDVVNMLKPVEGVTLDFEETAS